MICSRVNFTYHERSKSRMLKLTKMRLSCIYAILFLKNSASKLSFLYLRKQTSPKMISEWSHSATTHLAYQWRKGREFHFLLLFLGSCLFRSTFEYGKVTELSAGHCLPVFVMPYAFDDAVSVNHSNSQCGSQSTDRALLTNKNGAVGQPIRADE